MKEERVWVFVGSGAGFPSGVFTSRNRAEDWIRQHRLSGTLTAYPLDVGIYDWTLEKGYLCLGDKEPLPSERIASFSSAYLEHDHYEDGINLTNSNS